MKFIVKTLFLSIAFISIIFASSCATLTSDIEVETYSDPAANLNNYRTYAWAGSAQIIFDPVGQWEQPTLDTDEEVRFVVNRELRNRGINQVENDPDLLVIFAAGIDTTALELKQDPKQNKEVMANIPKAALLIALVDARTGYVAWSGYAVGDAQQQQSIDDIRIRIDYAVREIFKPYNR